MGRFMKSRFPHEALAKPLWGVCKGEVRIQKTGVRMIEHVAREMVTILNTEYWLLNTALAEPTKEVLQAAQLAVSSHTRNNSETPQAWAGQPRWAWGASPSRISGIWPAQPELSSSEAEPSRARAVSRAARP